MNSLIKYFAAFFLGIGLGFGIFRAIPYLPLPVSSPVFSLLGINKPRIIAFLPYFLANRATDNYNPDITTLDYFGFTLGPDGHIIKLANPQQEDPGWHDLQTPIIQKKLQDAQKNNIELSLSIVAEDEATITSLLSNPKQNAANTLADIIPILKHYHFTDVNIDVESFLPPDAKKVQAFTEFVQTIKNALQQEKLATITVDIAPIAFVKTNVINPLTIGKIADYLLIMTYDYSNVISPNTGPIAPLHGIDTEREYDTATTIAIAEKEIDPQKIIFGIPLYGYEWDSLSTTPGSATIPDTGQTASNKRITASFSATCTTCFITKDTLAGESDFIFQDNKGDPYYHQAFVFDAAAIDQRIAFVISHHLAGVGLWALGYEGNTLLQPLALYKNTFELQ